MFMIFVAVVSIAISILSYIQASKGQKSKLKAGELQATGADEGGSIPVVFGTCDVSPNVTAFLAGTPKAIKKKG